MASRRARSPSAASPAAKWCFSRATVTATPFRRTRSTTAPTSGRCMRRGVKDVVSVASVGGITRRHAARRARRSAPDHRLHLGPREHFLRRAAISRVTHIDFTEPYSRSAARPHASTRRAQCGEAVIDGGVYAATQGPRLETAAEIDRLERDGADMVGMTGMPEAALAREIGLRLCDHRGGRELRRRPRRQPHGIRHGRHRRRCCSRRWRRVRRDTRKAGGAPMSG